MGKLCHQSSQHRLEDALVTAPGRAVEDVLTSVSARHQDFFDLSRRIPGKTDTDNGTIRMNAISCIGQQQRLEQQQQQLGSECDPPAPFRAPTRKTILTDPCCPADRNLAEETRSWCAEAWLWTIVVQNAAWKLWWIPGDHCVLTSSRVSLSRRAARTPSNVPLLLLLAAECRTFAFTASLDLSSFPCLVDSSIASICRQRKHVKPDATHKQPSLRSTSSKQECAQNTRGKNKPQHRTC